MIHLLLLIPAFLKETFAAILTAIAERFIKHSHTHKNLQSSHSSWMYKAVAAEKEVASSRAEANVLNSLLGQERAKFERLLKDAQAKGFEQANAYVALKEKREAEANRAIEMEMELRFEVDKLEAKVKRLERKEGKKHGTRKN